MKQDSGPKFHLSLWLGPMLFCLLGCTGYLSAQWLNATADFTLCVRGAIATVASMFIACGACSLVYFSSTVLQTARSQTTTPLRWNSIWAFRFGGHALWRAIRSSPLIDGLALTPFFNVDSHCFFWRRTTH